MILMPRLRAALASVSCLMLVVPEVETTDLPLRSSIEPILLDFFETKRVAVRKWVLVKETCFRRSGLLVVDPHSMSMVALACPEQKTAASARPIIRWRFIYALLAWMTGAMLA